MNKIISAAILGTAFLLSGCSSEPSESDITKAIQASFDESNKQREELVGEIAKKEENRVSLISARKISCSKSGDKKYNCEVEMETKMPLVGTSKSISPLQFIKDDGRWRLVSG
ncbi:hypothetical protein ACWA06_08355 [Serratia rhizosphaerae]|uniref:hypothetical protein n=1 Tax=unclassified Serratia (in: enterobacteria) TaxID=2647522 RepID=UPI000DA292F3|nr:MULTISPECIES: hypothetical protein [unclassified Serratia (in: enterobacteria)]MBU3895439.1 hypothetical protein [Serratia rubidaea]MCA4821888.1 hypothetical protein [Serratia rubidaea]QNK31612.1 hypothetical protein HF675_18725 [Serratia sp. JUb9]QPT14456.1 hypothetical protein I6G37_05620 [Serratia rubidaea]CAE1143068.1 conserved protein of unknown function [Serratia sp. Tan611]